MANPMYGQNKFDNDADVYANGKGEVETITASKIINADESGKIFLIGTDALTLTLPSTAAGLKYTFINIGVDGNNIITISPAAADKIQGSVVTSTTPQADGAVANGNVVLITGADDKDLINTKATANLGDRVTLIGDGDAGWYIDGGVGVWAEEA